jgi:membrane dipeptidase
MARRSRTRIAAAVGAYCAVFFACGAGSPLLHPPVSAADEGVVRALQIHRDAIVLDGHNDITTFMLDYGFDLGSDGTDATARDATLYWLPGIRSLLPDPRGALRTDTDLGRLRAGGVDALFFSIYAHPRYASPKQRSLDMIRALYEQVERHGDVLELASSEADVRRIAAAGKIAALQGLEGGRSIEDDLANLSEFYELGVRYMTLTWSNSHSWADSSTDAPRHGGLSDFGRDVVREMNRLGMVVDVSHVSDETFYDALEVSRAPVMASHSSARALVDHPRNMSDAMLRAVAANGGVVMINFFEMYVDARKSSVGSWFRFWIAHGGWESTPLDKLIDHFVHVIDVAGIDHVGLGSDFDGVIFLPEGIKDVSQFPNITVELARRGLSPADLRKVLGENALRVLAAAEATASAMQAEAP